MIIGETDFRGVSILLNRPNEPDIYINHADVMNQLGSLDLTDGDILQGVETGWRYRDETTAHDVPSMPGTLQWGKTHRGLCDVLVPKSWSYDQSDDFPRIFHPHKPLAITVWNGDWRTGLKDKTPAPRQPRGAENEKAVRENARTLFDDYWRNPEYLNRNLKRAGIQTWVALVYIDDRNEEVRIEVSLPEALFSGGGSTAWRTRIILSAQPFIDLPLRNTGPNPLPNIDSGAIDVPVKRRA